MNLHSLDDEFLVMKAALSYSMRSKQLFARKKSTSIPQEEAMKGVCVMKLESIPEKEDIPP